ncbi:MAG: dethiobiotin synthase, partial [Solirubrobacteraceae bacterium]
MRGLFVTGTDTGVGKTVLSAALLAAMVAESEHVTAHKPAVTGLDEPPDGAPADAWPADHELLGAAAQMPADEVAPLRYGPAVSPLLAAELAGETLQARRLLAAGAAAVADREDDGGTVIVEGVGGLLSPLADNLTVCDLAVSLRLPVLIAARPGLGT